MATVLQYITGGVLFLALFAAGITVYLDMQDSYGFQPSDEFFGSQAQEIQDDIHQTFNTSRDTADDLRSNPTDLSNEDSIIVSSFTSMVSVSYNIFGLVDKVIELIAIALHIPNWIVAAILSILLLGFIIAVVSAVLGRNT